MTAQAYLLQQPDPDTAPARVLTNGYDTLIVFANSSAEANQIAQNHFADNAQAWKSANVTPATLAAATDATGWSLRARIYKVDGSLLVDETVTNAGQNEGTVAATGTLTNDGTNVSDGDTVTIGSRVYTFQTVLTNADGHVLIGASNTASMTNLFHAINASGGTPGTDYHATAPDPDVTATNPSGTTVVVTSKVSGTPGNSIASTETSSHLSWGAATLAGGTTTTNQVSSLAEEMVAALNAAGVSISGASFNPSTHVLTLASAADDIGDHTIDVGFYPPQPGASDSSASVGVTTPKGFAVTTFVTATAQGGSAGSALTATLVADTYAIPQVIVAAKADQ